jgi:alpha-amylase
MDSVLGYPLYYGIVDGFGTPNGNMSGFVTIANQVLTAFPVSASIYMSYGADSLDLN